MQPEPDNDLFREPSAEEAREALRRRAAHACARSARLRQDYRITVQASRARRKGDHEVEFAVASAAHGGDAAARDALLWRYAPMVSTLARVGSGGSSARQAELLNAGLTSLLVAIDGWDPATGVRFRDFAVERTRAAIQTHSVDVPARGDLPSRRHGRPEGG